MATKKLKKFHITIEYSKTSVHRRVIEIEARSEFQAKKLFESGDEGEEISAEILSEDENAYDIIEIEKVDE
jgi:hypothetical protein